MTYCLLSLSFVPVAAYHALYVQRGIQAKNLVIIIYIQSVWFLTIRYFLRQTDLSLGKHRDWEKLGSHCIKKDQPLTALLPSHRKYKNKQAKLIADLHPVKNTYFIVLKPLNQQCVVPENIQTPATEGISLRTPPPPWIFHFCRELMTPHPFGISTSVTKTPQPLWKSSFSRRKTIKVEE